jgi:hypothetical protein
VDVQQQCAALNEIPSRAYGPDHPRHPSALSINTDLQLNIIDNTNDQEKATSTAPRDDPGTLIVHPTPTKSHSDKIPLHLNPTHESTNDTMASPNEELTITCQKILPLPSPPPAFLTPASMSQIRLGVQPAPAPSHLAYISPAGTYNRKASP